MRLKLDENLSRACVDILHADGHDVATVASEAMTSASDDEVIKICRDEGRALVTLDLDFANPLVFPPRNYPGIAVLRLPPRASHAHLLTLVHTLAAGLKRESLGRQLWTVEAGRIRVYQPPPSEDDED